MRILYIYQYFGTPKGSWSTRVYEMAKVWIKEQNQVTVITSLYDKSDLYSEKISGLYKILYFENIKVIALNVRVSNKHGFLKRIWSFIVFSILATIVGLREKFDIVIASSGPITVGIPGLFLKFVKRKPLVFEVRDLWPRGAVDLNLLKNKFLIKLSFLFEKLCYNQSSLIVSCSPGMKDDILARYPYKPNLVVYNASDNYLFYNETRFELPPEFRDKKIVFYAGSLGLMDNCIQIVEGARETEKLNKNIHFIIFGEGAERKFLEEKAENYGLNNITFFGLKPKNEVRKWLSTGSAAILVFKNIPVLWTSSPNKMFDYFSSGLPVVQTTEGWIKELFENENCGINVNSDNAKEMAEAINKLVEDTNLQNLCSENALKLSKTKFNREVMALKYIDGIKIALTL